METKAWETDWVVNPGELLLEMMCINFVDNTTLPAEVLADFISGKQELTDEIKEVLIQKTNLSGEFWKNVEDEFREGLAKGKSWVKEAST